MSWRVRNLLGSFSASICCRAKSDELTLVVTRGKRWELPISEASWFRKNVVVYESSQAQARILHQELLVEMRLSNG